MKRQSPSGAPINGDVVSATGVTDIPNTGAVTPVSLSFFEFDVTTSPRSMFWNGNGIEIVRPGIYLATVAFSWTAGDASDRVQIGALVAPAPFPSPASFSAVAGIGVEGAFTFCFNVPFTTSLLPGVSLSPPLTMAPLARQTGGAPDSVFCTFTVIKVGE